VTVRRRSLVAGAAAAVLPGSGSRAVQLGRPRRHLTLLLGFSEGSGADKTARDFASFVAPHLPGTDLALVNMPGGAGRIMLAALGDAAPNGTTIGWVVTPTLPARMIDRGEPSLGQRLQLLGQVEREPIAFVSPSGDPANSIQDIIQRASDDADAVPQTQLNIVTFPSAAAARQAVLARNVSAAALGLSEAIGPLRDGSLSAIGIAARRRFGLLPDAPVLDESGIPLSAFIRRGIGVPAGTPPEATAALLVAIRAAAQDGAFAEQGEGKGYYAGWAEGAAWLTQMQTEQAALAKLWETNPWLSSSGG
jgi:tripartite-type tricarboxylate transporter receptor subunit TctC